MTISGDNVNETARTPASLGPEYEGLLAVIRRHGPMAVAYSGGVDSAFLAVAAREALGEDMVCVLAVSPSLAGAEYRDAIAFLERHGIPYESVHTREMDDERYRANDPRRCYYCKDELFAAIRRSASGSRFPKIAYGANADDARDYRPGHKAAAESSVVAPLAEAGYDKRLIRETAKALGLEVWDKPAAPCLASRIPYFSRVTAEKLRQVEAAEMVLKKAGFRTCRVRHYGDTARIEVPVDQHARLIDPPVWRVVQQGMRAAGFNRVEVEWDGFRSGRLNDALGRRGES
jgi:uncharacterized protein